MTILVPFLLGVLAVLAAVPFLVVHDPVRRGRVLRRAGFGWMLTVGLFGALFIAGETFSDPGGWPAVGMVLAWLVPLALLCWLAWARPRAAEVVLGVLLILVLGVVAWSVTGWHGYQAFRDDRGPYDAVSVFVLSLALGVLGLRRDKAAGTMLVVAALAPTGLLVLGSTTPLRDAATGSLGAASLPALVTGTLYLLAHASSRHVSITHRSRPATSHQ